MRTTSAILSGITASTTDKVLAGMFADAAAREVNASAAKEYVVWAAVHVAGRRQSDIATILPVGKSQVNNYVAHWDMWLDLGLSSDESVLTAAWNVTTGSRGWFAKRGTDAYKTLRDQVRATDDQDTKVALLTGTALPETAPKTPAETLLNLLKSASTVGQAEGAEPLVLTADQAREVARLLNVVTVNAHAAVEGAKVPVAA